MNDRDRIAELEEEVLQLKHLLGVQLTQERVQQIRETFNLEGGPAILLQALLCRKLLTWELAEKALSDPAADEYPSRDVIKVQMVKIRRVLRRYGVIVKTVWGVGYAIDERSAARVKAMLA